MENQKATTTRYAILVGIDAYSRTPLKHCVNDVQDIAQYLKGIPNPPWIQTLTAPINDVSDTVPLVEERNLWPTRSNLLKAITRVTSQAKAGDFVYIHFSGHGTRRRSYHELTNDTAGDLALVLLKEQDNSEVQELSGPVLAESINTMIHKGLVLTLVLDCCFSAAVFRGDNSIRFIPYGDLGVDLSLEPLTTGQIPNTRPSHSENRDVSMSPNWLITPDRYAIFAACGPHEKAREYKFEEGKGNGALSYFFLRALQSGHVENQVVSIYNHVRSNFRESFPGQTPALFGDRHQHFLGYCELFMEVTIAVNQKQDGSLELQAGRAQGVCENDRFALYGLIVGEVCSEADKVPTIAVVVSVGPLTAMLQLSNTATFNTQNLRSAKPLTRLSLRSFPISLEPTLPLRSELLIALKERGLALCNTGIPTFKVTLNELATYDVQDISSRRLANLPTLLPNQNGISSICDVVEHLVKFELVRTLHNHKSFCSIQDKFTVQVVDRSKTVHLPGSLIDIKLDESAKFNLQVEVENRSNEVLYLYLYALGSLWEVQSITSSSHETLPPKDSEKGFTGRFTKKMKLAKPCGLDEGLKEFNDILKIFVTSQPTSFDILELPSIGGKMLKQENYGSQRHHGSGDLSEDWATIHFCIRTHI